MNVGVKQRPSGIGQSTSLNVSRLTYCLSKSPFSFLLQSFIYDMSHIGLLLAFCYYNKILKTINFKEEERFSCAWWYVPSYS